MEVYWTAITYRTVAVYIGLVLLIVLAALYVLHPEWYSSITDRLSRTLDATPTGVLPPAQNQARFVNLDGTVLVKKVNSVNWANADYHTMLDKGDEIHAGADGAARITFVDGTTYTVKSDTFVTVEENAIDNDRSTSVAVHISSGAVDLATGTWDSPRSKAEVSFARTPARRCKRTAAPPCKATPERTRTRLRFPPAPLRCSWTGSRSKSTSMKA